MNLTDPSSNFLFPSKDILYIAFFKYKAYEKKCRNLAKTSIRADLDYTRLCLKMAWQSVVECLGLVDY